MDIDSRYLSDERDLEVLTEGVKVIRKIISEGYSKAGLDGMNVLQQLRLQRKPQS